MGSVKGECSTGVEDLRGRATLCLPDIEKDAVTHLGDDGFHNMLGNYFEANENNALERLVQLKIKLRDASTHDFWGIMLEEICDIMNAQCGYVSKRILVDDENTAVEMPPLGEPGSCLMGVGFYLNNGINFKKMYHDYRYHAYGSPCAYMKYDKVFIIPERMTEFVQNNPNALPWNQSEAFIGVPLSHEGKCFAHFGMIWSTEGAAKRQLSWGFIEMFLHALEDIVLQRIVEGRGFAKPPPAPHSALSRIIPLDAITVSQSLKPYARSLSHELRTPMQGVVGMLDIMLSTVMDALESQTTPVAKSVFQELKSNIEIVQESSKRAIEAADNVVHAYDLNMQMPETPLATDDDTGSDENFAISGVRESQRPDIVVEGSGISLSPTNNKRMRDEAIGFHPGPPLKRLTTVAQGGLRRAHGISDYPFETAITGSIEAARGDHTTDRGRRIAAPGRKADSRASSECGGSPARSPIRLDQTQHQIAIRPLLQSIVDDAVRYVRPVYKHTTPTELGALIEVRMGGPRSQENHLSIHLSTDADVPETIPAEEQHLQFALQKVVDNAIKFSDVGHIRITVKLARNAQLIEIRVSDTGCGLTDKSKAYLFKPHFQEDASLSRAKDGLGLSLFNAKAHVRKNLGGDLTLERSATEGPSKGCEFLIRIPAFGGSGRSRADTPRMATPAPGPRLRSPQASSQPSSLGSVPASLHTHISAPAGRPTPRRKISPSNSSPSLTSNRRGFNPNLAKQIPLTIMIAEDNVINRQILVGYLKKLGYSEDDIVLAFDGVEAVQQYEASLSLPPEKHIDTILMDLWMPNMDGYEATEAILKMADERGDVVAVMAVTADITSDSLARAKETGMKGFVSKPYKVLDIEHLILQHFRKDILTT